MHAQEISPHSYLVKSVLKSTAVQHSVAGSFSRPGTTECILTKGTLLELVVPSEDGSLLTLCEQSVFGSICNAQLLPWNEALRSASLPASLAGCDLLVLVSDSNQLAFVGFDNELQRFVNVGCLDLQKEGFSTVRPPALLAVDPASRAVALAAEAEHLALFHASAAAGGGIMKGALPNSSPPGVGHLSWDAILSMAFVRASEDETANGILKLAVIVRRNDSPGHEVLILFHDTRDRSTHLWARLPPSVNVCSFAGNYLPLQVLAPPKMSETLLIGRAGDLIALDLSFKGPVTRAAWSFHKPPPKLSEPESTKLHAETESLGLSALQLAADVQQAAGNVRFLATGGGAETCWELDLRSPDAEKTRVAKRRARGVAERPVETLRQEEVSFADWNEEEAEPKDEGSSIVKGGPSICSSSWRPDGSESPEVLVVSLATGGLQAVELRRSAGTDGPDLKFVPMGSCKADTCQACSAVAWLGDDLVGAFVRSGDGHVMKLDGSQGVAPVADIINAAPIGDFQLADHSDENQDQLFACCGEAPASSLRTIRAGISAERLLSTPPAYEGVTGTWAMRMSARDPHHAFLVMSFVSETRVLSVGLSFDDVTESVGFQQNASTLACGSIVDCHVVQVCAQAIHLCAPTRKAHPSGIDSVQPYTAMWRPPDGACISVGAVSTNRVVAGLSRPSSLVMLGVGERSPGGHVALVHLQSCRVDAELSCISLQGAGLGDDVSRASDDVSRASDDVAARGGSGRASPGSPQAAAPCEIVTPSIEAINEADATCPPAVHFAEQAGHVVVLGTYQPSIEVRSALPGGGFRLLASISLADGTAFQQRGISPGLGREVSDVRYSVASTSSCVPESVLLSFFDRGYLLVGLRNGILARYEWPSSIIERELSHPGSESRAPPSVADKKLSDNEAQSPGFANTSDLATGKVEERVPARVSPFGHKESKLIGNGFLEIALGQSSGPNAETSLTSGNLASPSTLEQVGEKRIGSSPVSLLPLSVSDTPGVTQAMPDYIRISGLGNAVSVLDVFSDVLALSDRPWLLHRSGRGGGRMVTSPISHPASAHATAVSCSECPRGIVFMTDCCMHLVELDASKKTDVRKLPCPGSPRRLVYHPASKTLITLCTTPVQGTERPFTKICCIDPDSGFIHSECPLPPHFRCVSISLWGGGFDGENDPLIAVGMVCSLPDMMAEEEIAAGVKESLLEEEPHHRGSLNLFTLRASGGSPEAAASSSGPQSLWKLEVVNSRSLPGPVLATCQFQSNPGGTIYLAVAAGSNVYLIVLTDPVDVRSRLKLVARTRTRFPVISLSSTTCHVSGEARLVVGDSQDGVLLYAFKPGVRKLELLFADKERRMLKDAAAVSDDGLSAFGADSGGGVAVMSADRRPVKSTSPEFNLDVMAWFNLGESPTRLRPGTLSCRQLAPSKPRHVAQNPLQSGPAMQQSDEGIIVATAAGGVVSLERVAPREYEFLDLVQQSLAGFKLTAPLMGNDYAVFRAKGSRAKGKPMLDADFLMQFLDLTEAQQLAVLAARQVELARAHSGLSAEGSGQGLVDRARVDADSCTRVREIAAVLIENL